MLDRLGPDLCTPDVDLDAVVARLASLDPDTELAVALLDQRVAAGIGNVFKSEVCWAERVSPFTPIGTLDEATRRRIYATARAQLASNLDDRPPHDVQERPRRLPAGAAPVPVLRDDDPAPGATRRDRSTYWCPQCQPDAPPLSG